MRSEGFGKRSRFGIAQRIVVLIAAAALLLAASAAGQDLAPRRLLPKAPVKALTPPPGSMVVVDGPQHRLVVKFRDEVRARTSSGALISLAAADVSGAQGAAQTFGMIFSPLIDLSEERLQQLEERAAARSSVAQPDLAGILKVEMPGADPAQLEAAGEALQLLPEVEFAYIRTLGVPPPNDIPPTTPDYTDLQTYFGPDPGMDADYAWALGFTGEGIRLSDCEYGWNYAHEDLHKIDLHPEPNQTVDPAVPRSWIEHGTSVVGQTTGDVNAYGINGMVPGAQVYTYPEYTVQAGGDRRVEAITAAIADSGVGDVVLLEMQTLGDGGGLGPAELDPDVWTVVKTGTDAGVIVVAAAGNGNQDLDSAPYAPYLARGDSGAIIVGAGSSDVNHDKLDFSTYGSRVNVQGWGEDVFTLGFPLDIEIGGDPNQRYTHFFGGTSGASPFVAAAAVALQDAADSPLSPEDLRDLLVQTGIPQGAGGHIGPFVNLRAALDVVLGINRPPECENDYFSTSRDTAFSILFHQMLANDDDPDGDRLWVDDYDLTTAQGGSNSWGSPFGFVYTPPSGFTGQDWFSYTAADAGGLSDDCTVFVDVGCDPVFGDSFDEGDFDNWSSTAVLGSATLKVTGEAAMEGPYGMQVTVKGAGDRAFVRDQTPAGETVYRARFLFRFDAAMSSGNLHRIFVIQDASPAANVVMVRMRKSGALFQLRAETRRDNFTWALTPWVDVSSQKAPLEVEVLWRAGDAGQSNGSLDFTAGGQTQSLTGIDNDSFQVDRAYLGLINGVDAGTSGEFHFDAFQSCRD